MMTDTFFHPLHTDIQPPSQLNNPFDYEPHPLCQLAFSDMLSHIPSHDEGKMYGVLVVRKGDEMGYLAAYSGQINGRADWDWFVPPVFDYLQPDGYFKQHENEITQINHEIERLENLEERKSALLNLAKVSAEADAAIAAFRQRMVEAKKKRDEIRKNDGSRQTEESASPVVSEDDLIRESQFMKAELRRLKKRYAGEITVLRQKSEEYESRILSLRNERKEKSDALQNWLFSQFEMLNAQGERRTLLQMNRSCFNMLLPIICNLFAWRITGMARLQRRKSVTTVIIILPVGESVCPFSDGCLGWKRVALCSIPYRLQPPSLSRLSMKTPTSLSSINLRVC